MNFIAAGGMSLCKGYLFGCRMVPSGIEGCVIMRHSRYTVIRCSVPGFSARSI